MEVNDTAEMLALVEAREADNAARVLALVGAEEVDGADGGGQIV